MVGTGVSSSVGTRLRALAACVAAGVVLSVGAAQAGACFDAVQDRIAWDHKGSKRWNPRNIEALCAGNPNSRAPAECFDKVMHGGVTRGGGGRWDWREASALCRGARNADATIDCFRGKLLQGVSAASAAAACARARPRRALTEPPEGWSIPRGDPQLRNPPPLRGPTMVRARTKRLSYRGRGDTGSAAALPNDEPTAVRARTRRLLYTGRARR